MSGQVKVGHPHPVQFVKTIAENLLNHSAHRIIYILIIEIIIVQIFKYLYEICMIWIVDRPGQAFVSYETFVFLPNSFFGGV